MSAAKPPTEAKMGPERKNHGREKCKMAAAAFARKGFLLEKSGPTTSAPDTPARAVKLRFLPVNDQAVALPEAARWQGPARAVAKPRQSAKRFTAWCDQVTEISASAGEYRDHSPRQVASARFSGPTSSAPAGSTRNSPHPTRVTSFRFKSARRVQRGRLPSQFRPYQTPGKPPTPPARIDTNPFSWKARALRDPYAPIYRRLLREQIASVR